jgi:predicted nuclease of restriction endonuclease-like (RecB) superfamily
MLTMPKPSKPATVTPAEAQLSVPADYGRWLSDLKTRIAAARVRAAVSANRELVLLYWDIGREIVDRFERGGWGAKVVEQLSHDLKSAYPDMKGFSLRNLRYMRAFAQAWPDSEILQTVSARLPWSHNVMLLDKAKDAREREWYARKCLEHGWSVNVLAHQLDSRLIDRSGAAITNFAATLPSPKSELAQQLTKDPHIFDFLGLGDEFAERELEDALVSQMQRFLMELGKGFAFMGRQYHLEVGAQDFYIDLLFYHVTLHCYVVIELKVDDFKPEYAGKLQFYLTALDRQVKTAHDGPSIGIILCRSKNKVVAEYALRDVNKPMGVSEYRLLPAPLRDALPSVEELESVAAFSGTGHTNAPAAGTLAVGPTASDEGEG